MTINPVLKITRGRDLIASLTSCYWFLNFYSLDDSLKNLTHIIFDISLVFLIISLETETLFSFTKEVALDSYENQHQLPYWFWFVCFSPQIRRVLLDCFLYNTFSKHVAIFFSCYFPLEFLPGSLVVGLQT